MQIRQRGFDAHSFCPCQPIHQISIPLNKSSLPSRKENSFLTNQSKHYYAGNANLNDCKYNIFSHNIKEVRQ
jgi:hypothetical protein